MKNVSQVSKLSGVSVRTLHHYDAIGLLKPTVKTEAGYRLYDDKAIARLQIILMFRALEFPLKDIKSIMDSPDFDLIAAVRQQIAVLQLKQLHLNRLIFLANQIIIKGEATMDFSALNQSDLEAYKKEVKEKWGNTAAYAEYEKRNAAKDSASFGTEFLQLFDTFGKLKNLYPSDERVQAAVKALKQYITDHCYTCTDEILSDLGKMYVEDQRFLKNIDAVGGEGTATFVQKAIACFCK